MLRVMYFTIPPKSELCGTFCYEVSTVLHTPYACTSNHAVTGRWSEIGVCEPPRTVLA
jgi:hypothetical protein